MSGIAAKADIYYESHLQNQQKRGIFLAERAKKRKTYSFNGKIGSLKTI